MKNNKRIVEKEEISTITELGVPYGSSIEDLGIQKAAKTTLKEHAKGRWNSSYSSFIDNHYQDIEAIANGQKVKYVSSTIYRDAYTDLLEIE